LGRDGGVAEESVYPILATVESTGSEFESRDRSHWQSAAAPPYTHVYESRTEELTAT